MHAALAECTALDVCRRFSYRSVKLHTTAFLGGSVARRERKSENVRSSTASVRRGRSSPRKDRTEHAQEEVSYAVGRRKVTDPVAWSAAAAERMLLYKDDDLLAVNKPAGLAVHGGPRLNDDLSDHLQFWQYEAASPPELAHRLDKDTSGVLLLTRNAESAKRMADLFRERKMIKKYWAITVGVPENDKGSVKIPIGRKNVSEKRNHIMNRVVLRPDLIDDDTVSTGTASPSNQTLPTGVHMARTDYEVMSLSSAAPRRACLLLVRPITGFKHQLRVHLADGLLCPVLGDYKFGGPLFRQSESLRRKMKAISYVRGYLYLHAAELEVPVGNSGKGKSLIIKAPPPPHFVQTARMLGLTLPNFSSPK